MLKLVDFGGERILLFLDKYEKEIRRSFKRMSLRLNCTTMNDMSMQLSARQLTRLF